MQGVFDLNIVRVILQILYLIMPLFFSLPCAISVLFLRKRALKKLGKEVYIEKLMKWAEVLQLIFVLEAFLTIYFIYLEGIGGGVPGFTGLIMIFVVRFIIYTFAEGKKRGVL